MTQEIVSYLRAHVHTQFRIIVYRMAGVGGWKERCSLGNVCKVSRPLTGGVGGEGTDLLLGGKW
jgi:hypothetical protein